MTYIILLIFLSFLSLYLLIPHNCLYIRDTQNINNINNNTNNKGNTYKNSLLNIYNKYKKESEDSTYLILEAKIKNIKEDLISRIKIRDVKTLKNGIYYKVEKIKPCEVIYSYLSILFDDVKFEKYNIYDNNDKNCWFIAKHI